MGAVKNFYHDAICAAEHADEPDVEVCANCGAYYDGRYGGKWQRCGPCRAGLEPASGTLTEGGDVEQAPGDSLSGPTAKPGRPRSIAQLARDSAE